MGGTYLLSEKDALIDLESRYAGESVRVSFTRSFTDGVASTICLPFPMNAATYKDYGTFYEFVGVEKGTDEWTVTMAEVNKFNGFTSASTPYLLLPKQTGAVTFVPNEFSSLVPLSVPSTGGFSPVDVIPDATDYPNAEGWTFKGSLTGEQWAEAPSTPTYGFSAQAVEADGISRGEFVRVGAKVRIRPFRAYLQYVEPSGARGMNRAAASDAANLPNVLTVRLIGADGELTGIGQMDARTGQVTFDREAWYTLDGVRLSGKPATNGVYINNGKMVVIK